MNQPVILLIEDDQFLREIYTETLNSASYQLDTAVDGEDALAKLPQRPWDLVLLDMMLPKVTGYEILQKIQSNPGLKTFKRLVLMTNVEPDAAFTEAISKADGYIVKSAYDPDGFLKKIQAFLVG